MRLAFWRKPKTEPTPEERLRAAVEDFNEAWRDYEAVTHWRDRIRPWMDWNDRRMTLTRIAREEVN